MSVEEAWDGFIGTVNEHIEREKRYHAALKKIAELEGQASEIAMEALNGH